MKIKVLYQPKIKHLGAQAMVPWPKTILVRDWDDYLRLRIFSANVRNKSESYSTPYDYGQLRLFFHECYHLFQFEKWLNKLWWFGIVWYYIVVAVGLLIPYPKKKPIEKEAYEAEKVYISPKEMYLKLINA